MRVYLNFGMGVDSTCILARWLNEPETRDFDLNDLTVLTAQTGDEFRDTKAAVEAHVLPLLRAHGVRFVQVARAQGKKHAVTVLSDTRQPDALCIDGHFKLSTELLIAGTVAVTANRRCSIKGKGELLDHWLSLDGTGEFRQIMGFNADEGKRVARDSCYGGDNRKAEYPLMAWGWGRERCEQYLRDRFGIEWPKSCCWHCPFQAGKAPALARLARHPQEAANALYLEHQSLVLNPLVPLYATGALMDKMAADKANDHIPAYALFRDRLMAAQWALFRVRRAYHAKGRADRSIEHVLTGTRADMLLALTAHAHANGAEVENDEYGIRRFYTRRREKGVYPTLEEMFVAGPADAAPKARSSFEATWDRIGLTVVR